MADREEDLGFLGTGEAVGRIATKPIGVNARPVLDVEAVGLEPPQHRILRAEDPALVAGDAGVERAIVARLGRASRAAVRRAAIADRAATVEAVAAVGVVGLPGGVRGLDQHVGLPRVVADDEHDVTGRADGRIPARGLRDIDARHRTGWHHPRRRDAPRAAIDQSAGGLGRARRLNLRQRRRRLHRVDLARAGAPVVAEPIDVDAVISRRRVDLEVDGAADIHAHVGGEPLNRGIPRSADVPIRIAGQQILGQDRIVLRL